jgi:hypothetical protein
MWEIRDRMARDLTSYPLHFEAQPSTGAPAHAELLGTGMLVAWAALRGSLAKKHAKAAAPLVARTITGREFLVKTLKGKLADTDLDKSVANFLYGYTHRLFLDDSERDRKATRKLLGLHRDDEIAFSDDYLATFKKVVKNPYLVPDAWAAYDRLAPILDARYADYQATKFLKPPPKGLYEKAVKARDAVKVEAHKVTPQKIEVDAGFTEQLLSIVGRPLADKEVKDILTVAGLPIGKRTDEQALPSLGVSYMGSKFEKKQLEVDDVAFYAKGVEKFVRGIGSKVVFAQYPGPLPNGIVWGDDRATVKKKVGGKPSRDTEGDEYLEWEDPKTRRYRQFKFERKKLRWIRYSMPRDFEG